MRRFNALQTIVLLFAGALTVALSFGALIAAIGFRANLGISAPVITIQEIKPAGVDDDAGVEMLVVSLSVSNCAISPRQPIYVSDSGVSLQAKVANRWIPLGYMGHFGLQPAQNHGVDVVIPAAATTCRVNFKWTKPRLTGGYMRWIAEQGWLPATVSGRLWRLGWGGFPRYRPSSHWQEKAVDLPIVPSQLHGHA